MPEIKIKVDPGDIEAILSEERGLTGRSLDQRIWEIWGYVRINKNSLDREQACNKIRGVIMEAVIDIQNRCESKAIENKRLRLEMKELRRKGRKARALDKSWAGITEEDTGI